MSPDIDQAAIFYSPTALVIVDNLSGKMTFLDSPFSKNPFLHHKIYFQKKKDLNTIIIQELFLDIKRK